MLPPTSLSSPISAVHYLECIQHDSLKVSSCIQVYWSFALSSWLFFSSLLCLLFSLHCLCNHFENLLLVHLLPYLTWLLPDHINHLVQVLPWELYEYSQPSGAIVVFMFSQGCCWGKWPALVSTVKDPITDWNCWYWYAHQEILQLPKCSLLFLLPTKWYFFLHSL